MNVSRKEIFDALTGDSRDGCDPDWCREVLDNANQREVRQVQEALASDRTESETAITLGVMP